ncbi:hypothetical protein [Mycobacterium decipiens]
MAVNDASLTLTAITVTYAVTAQGYGAVFEGELFRHVGLVS